TAFARRLSRRSLAAMLVLAVAAIWVHRIGLTLGDAPVRRLYFAPDTSLDPIVLGCLLALLYDGGHVQSAYRNAVVRRLAVPGPAETRSRRCRPRDRPTARARCHSPCWSAPRAVLPMTSAPRCCDCRTWCGLRLGRASCAPTPPPSPRLRWSGPCSGIGGER